MTLPQRLTDRKRDAILHAAIIEFRTHGFEATSMDKIAASAEVSKRTVYNHFPSKDELFAEILLKMWESSATQDEILYRRDRPLREQLLALMNQKMRMLADDNFLGMARVAIAETIHSPERARELMARIGQREEGVTVWIRAAQADKKLKPADPSFASHHLQGQLKTFAFWPQVTMGEPPLTDGMQDQVVESAVDMFLGYYELSDA